MFLGNNNPVRTDRLALRPATGIFWVEEDAFNAENARWEVWHKTVKFAEYEDLTSAADHLQKLLDLDNIG